MFQVLNGRAGLLAAGVAAAALMAPLAAQAATVSGSSNGFNWTAQSTIVGAQSTATVAGGGNPTYLPDLPKHRGVVSLIMNYGPGQNFICSGSLLSDRRSIVTAGHCVSDGAGTDGPLTTKAYFWNGNPESVLHADPTSVAVNVTDYFVNPNYTGEVVDQNDIAVLRLATDAPVFAQSYNLDTDLDLTGDGFNVAGVGGRSDGGGNVGANLGVGRLREGDNRYDFRLGDSDFGGFWDGFFGTADVEYSYLSDFDNGLAANDASCKLAVDGFGFAPSAQYCNLGLGVREVGVAGGDSGGPQFRNGRISSVTSYGLTFGPDFGDIDQNANGTAKLNSSFGEFSGYVPVAIHREFIHSAMVPEPGMWALMIMGFMGTGAVLRRRKTAAVA